MYGTTKWFRIEKGHTCLLSPCLFNFYEHFMWNSALHALQTGIKIARKNINNLRYTDDTTLMAENEEEIKSLFSSVHFSHSVMSDSLRPHGLQHARPPCPSPTPGVHSDSHPSSWWCHPAISSSVIPFSSCPQSLPSSESFPMSQLFTWGGQSTGVSALASALPKNTQGWSPLE